MCERMEEDWAGVSVTFSRPLWFRSVCWHFAEYSSLSLKWSTRSFGLEFAGSLQLAV